MSYRVRKNDNVVIITGQEKGKTGKVIFVDPEKGFVKVEGRNIVSKHKKPRSAQDPGGIQKFEGNINISNVQVVCPSCDKATRLGAKIEGDKKTRVCKKCGASLEFKAEKAKKKDKDKDAKAVRESKSGDSRVKRTRKVKEEDTTTPANADEKNN